LVLGGRPLGAILHSSNEPGELSQWLCHDDSTMNIVLDIIIIIIIVTEPTIHMWHNFLYTTVRELATTRFKLSKICELKKNNNRKNSYKSVVQRLCFGFFR